MQIEDTSFHQHEPDQMPNTPQLVNQYSHSPRIPFGDAHLQARLQQSLINSQWGFWNWDLSSDKIAWDGQWWENLSYGLPRFTTRQEFTSQLIHPDDLPLVEENWRKCLSGETSDCQVVYRLLITNREKQSLLIIERGKVSHWDKNHQPAQVMGSQELVNFDQQTNHPLTQNHSASDLLDRVRERIARQGRFDSILRNICEDVRSYLTAERVIIYQLFANEKNIVTSIANISTFLPEQALLHSFPLNHHDIQFYERGNINIIDLDHIDSDRINSLQIEYLQKLQVKTCAIVPILEYGARENEHHHQVRLWGLFVVHISNQSSTQLAIASTKQLETLQPTQFKPKPELVSSSNLKDSIFPTWNQEQISTLKQISNLLGIALQKKHLTQHRENAIATLQLTEVREKELQAHIEQVQSELEQYKQKLIDCEKYALLGHVIAAVSSEIHNPINFIYSTLKPVSQHAEDLIRLLEFYQTDSQISPQQLASNFPHINPDYLKTELLKQLWSMRSGSDRLQTILFALQQLATSEQTRSCKYNLHEGINSSLVILQHRLKANNHRPGIQVIKDFAQLPQIECYPSELNQVFIHLINNAIDAIEQKLETDYSFAPTIRIRTAVTRSHLSVISSSPAANISTQQQEANVTESRQERQYFQHKITITISDNGNGILPHIQRRIFTPFFTSKSNPHVQGLGLTTSKYIIEEKHSGKLRCHSQFGQGTEFIIELNIKNR